MAEPSADRWADSAFLRDVQYRTDANLAARQSIYAYQDPPSNLMGQVLDLAAPAGPEVVADVGCGNGLYLAELARRGHVQGQARPPGVGCSLPGRAQHSCRHVDSEHVADYVRSMPVGTYAASPERLIPAVISRLPDRPHREPRTAELARLSQSPRRAGAAGRS